MFHHEKDDVEYHSHYLKLYERFVYDIFAIWCGPKGTLNALNTKTDRIKLTYCSVAKVASLFWICFSMEILLRRESKILKWGWIFVIV